MDGHLDWQFLVALLAGIVAASRGLADILSLWRENPQLGELIKRPRFWLGVSVITVCVLGLWGFPYLRAPVPATIEIGQRVSDTVIGHDPKSVAEMSDAMKREGFVLVGGGCKVSYQGNGSVHAELLFVSKPEGDGWVCEGTDPVIDNAASVANPQLAPDGKQIVNEAKITAYAIFAAISSKRQSYRLATVQVTQVSPISSTPEVTATIADKPGFVLVGGGCETASSGGQTYPEPIVISAPSRDNDGWHCVGADPPDHPNIATIKAYAIGAKLEDSDFNWFRNEPRVEAKQIDGGKVTTTSPSYPHSIAIVASDAKVTGGGCEVSYFSAGSQWTEYMVENGPEGKTSWGCMGADPPFLPNTATANAYAISLYLK